MVEYIDRKDAIISDLKACKTAFDLADMPWVIMGGIVLGYARYKDVMSWDTDVDLGVFVELDANKWQLLYNSLNENGFKFNNNKIDFICCNRKAEFNMWMFHKSGNYYEAFPKSTPGLKFIEKAKWFDEIQTVGFLGNKYPMPNYIEDFLDAHYGTDWETNIIKDHGQYFNDKRGGSDPNGWLLNRKRKEDGNLWWPALLKINENIGDFNEI